MEKQTADRPISSNAANLHFAFDYLQKVLKTRLDIHFNKSGNGAKEVELPSLGFYDDGSVFSRFITQHQPSFEEYVILLLALAPHVQPNFLGNAIKSALPVSGDFSEIGGVKDSQQRGFLPTGETAHFILAGDDLERRFEVQEIFSADHWFSKKGILHLEPAKTGQPYFSGRILLSQEYIELFTFGKVSTPAFSPAFPAKEISTQMDWDDLVLDAAVMEQIEELKTWVQHNGTLLKKWGMAKKIKPGYRALFHGPSGTGKTLTATLLGKYTGRKVFRVDLSTVVSKYIGETEKNLSNLFDKAKNKNWILFFDEADALFGKRTSVKDAHDRFANQEISYLLQRVEDFDGLVILASNFKANMDEAFLRRFNAIIKFPFPKEKERMEIWRKSFPENIRFAKGTDIPALVAKYEIAGGSIINAVHFACLKAVAANSKTVGYQDVLLGIRREIEKGGKLFKEVQVAKK
ncbi:MAG TPA: ATP-binding protein [Bacteroidetes bacterium]|nr:ATP-binding protein [Bacteroidota bacterium]